ncbi:MAG: hypothetical protein IH965_14945 [Gemmatimonadetes bacterium]|nr:hypothetical protein [Gemmatimonadota bacterium]
MADPLDRLKAALADRYAVPHPFALMPRARWYSEALLPSQFLKRFRGDPLAEGWTHADG